MGWATALAVYGALVATVTFLWRLFEWTRANRHRVDVRLGEGEYPGGTEDSTDVIWIEVINHSPFPVPLAHAWLSEGRAIHHLPGSLHGPNLEGHTVPARDHAEVYFDFGDIDQVVGAGVHTLRAEIQLATGGRPVRSSKFEFGKPSRRPWHWRLRRWAR